jgi:multicomponent Na+:H+ antiporter subunit B
MAEGSAPVRRAIGIDPRGLIVAGMALALFSGLLGLFAGAPFLTGLWWVLPEVGGKEVALGTPLLFDIGVYAIVLGTILTLILALEEE